MDLIAQGKQARTEYENRTLGRDQAEARRDLHGTLQRLRQERRALTKSIRIDEAKKRKERFQDLYNAKQKLASSMINNKKGKRVEPNTLKDGTSKQVMYKKADVLAETQRYYQELNAPPPGGKCQQYLPDQCHRCYPWIGTDALDTFHLESHIGQKNTNSLILMTISGIRLPSSNASGTPSWARPLGQTRSQMNCSATCQLRCKTLCTNSWY